ncbi:MAG: hypothetical protein ACE3JP_00685 [Ectobacillus sp.]
MSLKKKTEVRTGKMVRELMLADKDVTASLIMVYSNNNVNEEIKIEGLAPKSNEELFLSGNVDWNQSVIYKIVDFSGKAEVGKAMLVDMKKNNVTLQIERVMWSKGKQDEEPIKEAEKSEPELLHTMVPAQKEQPKTEAPAIKLEPKKQAAPVPSPPTAPAEEKKAVLRPVETERKHAAPIVAEVPELQDKYDRLCKKAIAVCQDYELGMDVDDSIEGLKAELEAQGLKIDLDPEFMKAIEQLRSLKAKGIQIEKIMNLI